MAIPRNLVVAAAQLGPNKPTTPREEILDRMLKLMNDAASNEVQLLVYPELALTTFFPRFAVNNAEERSLLFEPESANDPHAILKSPNAERIFSRAKDLGIDVALGYAERWTDKDGQVTDYNTMIYYSATTAKVLSKYRKVHLPGTKQPVEKPNWDQQLEKMYFTPGDLAFEAFRAPGLVKNALKATDAAESDHTGKGDLILGMMICNDRRWPEVWRCFGLQGVEIILQGYNTTGYAQQLPGSPQEQEELAIFHHRLSCQAGSYQNACFSINTAKAGDEGTGSAPLIANSIIVAPNGKIIAESKTSDDELVVTKINLNDCRDGKSRVFAFEKHRRVEHYARIVEQTGVIEPPLLS